MLLGGTPTPGLSYLSFTPTHTLSVTLQAVLREAGVGGQISWRQLLRPFAMRAALTTCPKTIPPAFPHTPNPTAEPWAL